MIIPLQGYAPDLDTTLPGVLTNCASLVPSLKGLEGAPSMRSHGIAALAAACQGAIALSKVDGTTRFFAGSATKLYELSSTSWTDRSRAVGGNYGLASDARWSFAQFGDVSLASAKSDVLQSSSSGAYADITGAPQGTVVEVVGQFVFLFDTTEATNGDQGDRYWHCAKGDHTNWTPSIASECGTGRLTSSPGKIVAGKRFGDSIIAYKSRSMYLGNYVGPPKIWDFVEIPGGGGALGHYAVVNISTPEEPKHVFMGYDDFYRYDGSRPVRIGTPLRETVYAELNRQYAHLAVAMHDAAKSRVYFYYPASGNTTLDKCVVYNYKTDKWGRDDRTVEMPVLYITPGVTYDGLGALYPTYDGMPSVGYDSTAYFGVQTQAPAVFDTAHTLKTLDGASVSSSLTTGDYGDDQMMTMISRIIPRFLTKPSDAMMTNYYRNAIGDALTTGVATRMSSSRFDVMREARWHRIRLDFTGPVELSALNAIAEQGGEE